MSLQVWLPLNDGTLRQQGLSSVVPNGTAFTSNASGKMGQCITTTSAGVIDLGYNGNMINTESISFGGWFRFNKTAIGNIINPRTYNSTYPYATGQFIGNASYGGIGLVWTSNNMNTSPPFASMNVFGNIRTSTVNRNTSSYTIPFDVWVHIFLTFNKSTGDLTLFINGETFSTTTFSSFNDARSYPLGINYHGVYGGNGPGLNIPFDCNDIRIYDHCLSDVEVKEISRGLVCHYTFGDKYLESTTNLITTDDCLSATCYNGATSKYSYGTTTDMYKTVGTFQGRKCTKVYFGTNGTAAFPYVYFNNLYTSNGGSYPLDKTLSFDYYSTISTSIRPYKLGSGSGTATYKVTNTTVSTGTGTDAVTIPVVPNMWNHVEVTFHGTTSDSAQWGYFQNYPSHTANTSNYWLFANAQLEAKDHATGYAGVGGTHNSLIVYDSSGFANNGTISGNLTINSVKPKYASCIYIPAAATISHNRCLDNTNQQWTCTAWVKPDVAGNYQNLNNFNACNRLYHGTYPLLYLNSGTNDYYNYGNKAIPAGEWTHVAFVFDNATGTKIIYLNGVNQTNTGGPNKTSTPAGIPESVVLAGGNYAGYLSDYREYATALSADDVLSLYQNEAAFDDQGNLLGPIR